MVVVLVIVTVVALPTIATAMANARLRSSADNVANLVQKTRMQAAQDRTFYSSQSTQQGSATVLYVDLNHNNLITTRDPVVVLEQGVSFASAGTPATTSMSLNYTPQAATVMPAFNLDGLPCQVDSQSAPTSCTHMPASGPVGFLVFLTAQSGFASPGWAAVSVTPAGRVRVWMWSGSAWE